MTVAEKTRWKNWADGLRQEMMTSLTAEVTKSLEAITSETSTTKAESSLRSARSWRACQMGESPIDFLAKAGFEIEFQQDEQRSVREVTLRLNQTWMAIHHQVLARRQAQRSPPRRCEPAAPNKETLISKTITTLGAITSQDVLVIAGIVAALLALLIAAVLLRYGALWFQAYMSGADVRLLSLIGMSLRQVKRTREWPKGEQE